jgi:hypothetical protein
MPVGGFSVGRDISLVIVMGGGALLPLGLITGFDAKPMTSEIKILGLDGKIRPLIFPEGWGGSFKVTRQDSSLDDYWAGLEADYYNGVDLPTGIISETITNPDGSTSAYRYQDVMLKYTDAGSWAGNKEVQQSLDFMASRRVSA